MILKVILFALCANLLYTNANLMMAASEEMSRGMAVLMVFFALTYSLISTLSLFKLQSAFTAVCFAVLDGFAVYSHLSVHGENFKTVVGVYFGIYTAYTLIVAYIIKRQEDRAQSTDGTVEGHDAAYWFRCFKYQKDRADGKKPTVGTQQQPQIPMHKPQTIAQTTEPELPMMQTVTPTPTVAAPKKPFQIAGMTDDEARELLSVKRAFARVQDTDKRRERAAQIKSETVRMEICRLYGLQI